MFHQKTTRVERETDNVSPARGKKVFLILLKLRRLLKPSQTLQLDTAFTISESLCRNF